MTPVSLDTARIAETAYHIWQEEGQPQGRDEAHWFAAIERLSAPAAVAVEKPTPAKKTKAKAAPKKAAAKPRARKAAKAE